MIRIQRFLKKVYKKIQEKRAKELNKKLLAAIVAYKTEKRREYEMDAAKVIESVYNKYLFRQHLTRAISSRQFLVDGLMDLAKINRCRKMWICRR